MSHKCLCDLTLEMHKAGETVKKFPNYVIGFLNELSICVENGFIYWIKDIIKGMIYLLCRLMKTMKNEFRKI